MLSKLAFHHDCKKAAEKHSRPRHRPQVPRYAGRWPFIGDATASAWLGDGAVHPATGDRRQLVGPPTEASVDGLDEPDNVISTIRRNPLLAIGLAAGVGLALALAFTESDVKLSPQP